MSADIPQPRTTLSVSISSSNFECDSCHKLVSVVRTGPGIEGQVCDDCAGL